MRVKPGFSHLSWLVFLAYLLFGLGGSLVSACCAGAEPAAACMAVAPAGEAVLGLISLERADGHCHPCLDHCQTPASEQFHLAARQVPPRLLQTLATQPFSSWRLQDLHAAAAGIFLVNSSPAQNSVLRTLRSTILLI